MIDGNDNGNMPPHWAWHEWRKPVVPASRSAPTFEDYRRAGLVSGDYEFGADGDEKPILSPVVAMGLAGLTLWWLSHRSKKTA